MTHGDFLIDTSALVRLLRDPVLRVRWEPAISAGIVAICPLTELEFLYSARSAADRRWLLDQLELAYPPVPMPDHSYRRAAEVQAELNDLGSHRSAGAVDLLIAATAELHDLTLLHYDHDFEQISRVTGQPMKWVAPAGSVK
ncbi:PIN domain nuclease [Solwaraspora sp. WMMD1047]|uniref:PIN domain nuclease n=1 Tax=Solwaraspora sp. WMMD1047 TaxID=3016102 RepID=UPI0024175785|nr:PIN domain nuclease [Solwaraspora sp. WMMD1047]MDG4834488.1 PIN domain nuclease [Solwaraspora sp. WMMD1047]